MWMSLAVKMGMDKQLQPRVSWTGIREKSRKWIEDVKGSSQID